jgi:hypothetical protein
MQAEDTLGAMDADDSAGWSWHHLDAHSMLIRLQAKAEDCLDEITRTKPADLDAVTVESHNAASISILT